MLRNDQILLNIQTPSEVGSSIGERTCYTLGTVMRQISNISRELGTRQPRNKHTINRTNFRVMFKPLGTGGKVGRNLQKILSFMRENSLNLKADASLALWSCLCLSGRPPLNGPQLDFSE